MFVSRSSLEKPRPFERWVRTTSPSRYSTLWSFFSSSAPTSSAIVDLPAPDKPVNQSVNPERDWSSCPRSGPVEGVWGNREVSPAKLASLIRLLRFDVNAAFQFVRAGPAAGALLLVGRGRPRAGDAADRAVAGLVQRVVWNLVDLDVGPDALLVPVRQRVELPDPVAVRPLQLRRRRAARRLVAADAGDPGVVRAECLQEGLDLADVAAAIRVGFPEIRALAPVLLGNRDHLRTLEREPVTLDEPVARLVALTEEELRVQLDHGDVEPELADHVHEHRRLLLPGARQAELVAELLEAPAEELLGRHRLEVELRKGGCGRHRATPPSTCRREDRAGASRAGSPRRAGCCRGSPRGRSA